MIERRRINVPAEPIGYDDAVREAKQLVARGEKAHATIDSTKMRLGELAHRVKPKYGEETITRFASDIGVAACTLRRCRSVFRAWNEIQAPAPKFAVAQELQSHPGRAEIIKRNPNLTKQQARKLMRGYKKSQEGAATQEEWERRDNRRRLKQLRRLANEGIREAEFVRGNVTAALREAIDPPLLETLRQAAEAWLKLVEFLEKVQRESRGDAGGRAAAGAALAEPQLCAGRG
jgi:hypothetical protein